MLILKLLSFLISHFFWKRSATSGIWLRLATGNTCVNIDGETGLVLPPSDMAALRYAMRNLW